MLARDWRQGLWVAAESQLKYAAADLRTAHVRAMWLWCPFPPHDMSPQHELQVLLLRRRRGRPSNAGTPG
jgi:hypothetical protein